MAIYALGDRVPDIHPDAYVHPDATVIGNVVIGPESSVWPQAVLRGDQSGIRIGARTSIQDGSVIHCTHVRETVVGDDCVIGHMVHLEGCEIEAGSLVGVGAIVLEGAKVGRGSLVAAGAVVLGRTEIPPGSMAMGVPAKIRPDAVDPGHSVLGAAAYVENARRYPRELRRLD